MSFGTVHRGGVMPSFVDLKKLLHDAVERVLANMTKMYYNNSSQPVLVNVPA